MHKQDHHNTGRGKFRHLSPADYTIQIPDDPRDPSICPRFVHENDEFHSLCPEYGRPLMRDYIDWRMSTREPARQGTLFYYPFWARIWLVLWLVPTYLDFYCWHLIHDTRDFPITKERTMTS